MSEPQKITITGNARDVTRIWDDIRAEHGATISGDSSMTVSGSQGVLELKTSDSESILAMQLLRLLGVKVNVATL